MKKYLILGAIILQTTFLFGQGKIVYNENGITLGYSNPEKYNSIELNGNIYDQYEVKFTFSNNSGRYIHNPDICRIGFKGAINHPSSSSEINFVESGNFNGYFEYADGTPLPENLDSSKEEEKYGRVVTRFIIKKGITNECVKYILVKQGEEIGEPDFNVGFNSSYPVYVNGSDQLIETWINREANGVSLNNVSSWPVPLRGLHEGQTLCGNTSPIGNKGDVANKKITVEELRRSLSGNIDEKKKVFKDFFIQNGFQFQTEGNQTLKICVDDTPENSINGYCLVFLGFKISFTNSGETVFYTNINEMPETGEKAYDLISSDNDGGIGGCEYGSALYLE